MPQRGRTKISDLRKRLDKVQHLEHLPARLGVAGVKLVGDCFISERSPYGESWAPLKYRRGRILRLTGRMYNSRSYRATGRRITLFIGTIYSGAHQDPRNRRSPSGRVWRMPKRTMVPDGRGMPKAWEAVMYRETVDELRKVSLGHG